MQTAPAHEGRPAGAPGRLAVPVAGTDPGARKLVMELVDDTGFDPVDAGTADDGWRMQAGTPACCTGLDAGRLRGALALAGPEAARVRRGTAGGGPGGHRLLVTRRPDLRGHRGAQPRRGRAAPAPRRADLNREPA
ncbi:hypothetical protein AY578_25090 [Streptomyces thermocarboxydus]|uniref:hypothetical protein n=1 Tax=Streptomyces thermocarboxydus TaxID=59299 RepID=UPI0021645964|nr:hypothetical protein AY578_25090 [Streptomyces thermocarboxydus]